MIWVTVLYVPHQRMVYTLVQHGTSALHAACVNGHSHIAEMLIERGSEVDILDKVTS